jgi:hypothetical protein
MAFFIDNQKWAAYYFALALDCSLPILDAIFMRNIPAQDNHYLFNAAKNGDERVVNAIATRIEEEAYRYTIEGLCCSYGLYGAIKGEQDSLITALVSRIEKITDGVHIIDHIWNTAMGYAAGVGRRDLVEFFAEEKGAYDWNVGLRHAATGGHIDIVSLFVDRGVSDWLGGIYNAAAGGYGNIVYFFASRVADHIDMRWGKCMIVAVIGGYMDLVQFFIDKGARNWRDGLGESICCGRLEFVKFFTDKLGNMSARELRDAIRTADSKGHADIAEFFQKKLEKAF